MNIDQITKIPPWTRKIYVYDCPRSDWQPPQRIQIITREDCAPPVAPVISQSSVTIEQATVEMVERIAEPVEESRLPTAVVRSTAPQERLPQRRLFTHTTTPATTTTQEDTFILSVRADSHPDVSFTSFINKSELKQSSFVPLTTPEPSVAVATFRRPKTTVYKVVAANKTGTAITEGHVTVEGENAFCNPPHVAPCRCGDGVLKVNTYISVTNRSN